jgi:hypothetical protein
MDIRRPVLSNWTPISEIPMDPTNGRPIYRRNQPPATVFIACTNQIRLSEVRKLFTSSVAHYPLSRHVSTIAGRCGVMWDILVNKSELHSARYANALAEDEVLWNLPGETIVQVVNAANSGLQVNYQNPRSNPRVL